MTNKEATKILKAHISPYDNCAADAEANEAIHLAIKSLEQEECEDCISRAEAIRIASGYCHPANIASELKKLQSVRPKRITGHWTHDGSHWKNRFLCSECNYKIFDEPTNYCPNCGLEMEST